jgi:hypothetical protein
VQLYVGADVEIERVALEIKGVEAQAQLKARLDNVLAIVQRALDTVDQHPEILTDLSRTTRQAAAEVGDGAGQLSEGVAQTGGQLAEGAGEAGQLAEGVAGATESSEPEGERPRAKRGGSQGGSRRRKAGSSAS